MIIHVKSMLVYWQYFFVSAMLLIIMLLQPNLMLFERDAINAGEWWRLFTGQFVHISAGHFIGNVLALGVAYLLFSENWRGWKFVTLLLICATTSNMGMYYFHPEIENYVGISGALYGLIAFGALTDWFNKVPFGRIITLGLILKVVYEFYLGPIAFTAAEPSDAIAVQAHLYGAITGFLLALLLAVKTYFQKQTSER